MGKYVFVYHGGSMAETEEERQAQMAKWGAWFGQLGGAIVDGGAPVGAVRTVNGAGAQDGAPNPVSGYTLIEADSLDAASEMAGGCPVIERGGSVEVGETIPIEM